MLTTLKGIVLRERIVGENSKFIDILTAENGIIEASVRGSFKINSCKTSSTQLFAYSTFTLNKRKDIYYINSAEPIEIFYGLRDDLKKLSLASYLSEIILYAVPEHSNDKDVLRLFLNTLHYTAKGNIQIELLKSIFEMRFMSLIGLMPDLVMCHNCGKYENEKMYMLPQSGIILCDDCFVYDEETISWEMSLAVLKSLRHITFADFNRLFFFKLSDKAQSRLSFITEEYLRFHLDKNFKTLDFYKSIE